MIAATKLLPQGAGLASALLKRAHQTALDWDMRQKSRFSFTDSAGREIGAFLPRGGVVRGGDVLLCEDGSMVQIQASAQPLLRITICAAHGTPLDLLRAAYHLGNRHVTLEAKPSYLQIEPDHVLAEMLRAMHLIVTEVAAPFEPESGAYATSHAHGHDHHSHDHEHDHGHPQAAAQAHLAHEHHQHARHEH